MCMASHIYEYTQQTTHRVATNTTRRPLFHRAPEDEDDRGAHSKAKEFILGISVCCLCFLKLVNHDLDLDPSALAQWLAVLVLDGGYRSLPGGNRDGRNPGEIGVDLPCELAPTSKYPRFDLAIGGTGGANLKNPRCPREPQPPTWPRPTPPCPLRGGCR